MPWIKVEKKPRECRTPSLIWHESKAVPGNEWQCRKCNQVWVVRSSFRDGFEWVRR